MPYSITASDDGRYIILKERGDLTREVAMQHTIEAHALGAELGIRCYLVDVTESRNVESAFGNYQFARRDMQETPALDLGACVAVLADPEDTSHDFYEVVATDAGLDLTLFRDRKMAVEHLLQGAARLSGEPSDS